MEIIIDFRRALLVSLIMLAVGLKHNIAYSQENNESLIGKSAVLIFDDKEVSGIIVEELETKAYGDYIGLLRQWKFVADVLTDISDDDWNNYRGTHIDGKTIIGNVLNPQQLGIVLIIEHFRISKIHWFEFQAWAIIEGFPTTERIEHYHTSFFYNGVEHYVSMRVRIIKVHYGNNHYLVVDQVTAHPKELTSSFGDIGEFQVEIAALFDGMEFFSQEVWWDMWSGFFIQFPPFTAHGFNLIRSFEHSLWDFLYNEPLDIRLRIIDRDRRLFFKRDPIVIADKVMSCGTVPVPPPPPTLIVSSKQSSLTISISTQENVDSYSLYKSENPDFTIEEAEKIVLSEPDYEDTDVSGGTTYYYRASVKSGSLTSNLSNMVSGMPLTQYEMSLEPENIELQENSVFTINGILTDLDNQPVSDAMISITNVYNDYTFESITTNEDGSFQFVGRSSTSEGVYEYRFVAGDQLSGIQRTIHVDVFGRAERGRDVSIDELSVDNILKLANQTISTDVTITNNGIIAEGNIDIHYKLRNQNGELVVYTDKSLPVLQPGSTTTISHPVLIPDSTPFGNYNLEVLAFNEIGKDEFMANNRFIKSIYVNEEFNTPVYRTMDYTFSNDNQCKTIDGYTLCVEQIIENEVNSIIIKLDDEYSPQLDVSLNEDVKWFNQNNDFIVIPKEAYTFVVDSIHDFFVKIRAGKINSLYQVDPNLHVIKPGHWGDFQIQGPSGSTIDLNSFTFKYGDDEQEMNNWLYYATSQENLNSAKFQLNMPEHAEVDTLYNSFLRWDDQQYRLFKEIKVKCAPIREIKLSDINVYNNYEEYLVGDEVLVDGNIINKGLYAENQIIELSIKYNEETVFSDYRDYSLNSGQNKSFNFAWSSIGQELGVYDIEIKTLNDEDESPENTIFNKQIEFVETPELIVEVIEPALIYEIGDNAVIEVSVKTEYGAIIDDASILLTITQPDNKKTVRGMAFNAVNNLHSSSGIRLNMGGNYHFSAEAEHHRYISATNTGMIQTYVDVLVEMPTVKTNLLIPIPLRIAVSNVGDLSGFAGDLLFNTSKIKTYDVNSSGFLCENSNVPISLIYHEGENSLILGITRLTGQLWGAITQDKKTILTAVLLPISDGNRCIEAESFGLIASSGHDMATRIVMQESEIEVNTPHISMRVTSDKQASTVNVIDTAAVFVNNAYNISAIAGDIVFDPDKIEIIDVWEGSILNDNGESNTILQTLIDNQTGRVIFGLTRTVQNDPGVNTSVGRVLNFSYKPLASGSVDVSFENTGIINVIDYFEMPHTSYSETFDFEEAEPGNAHIFLEPELSSVFVDSVFQLTVYAEYLNNVSSFVGDIFYNPQHLEIVEIIEGSFLNENGTASTAFMNHNDTSSGILHVGLSRLGAVDGVDAVEPEDLFTISFKAISIDSTSVIIGNSHVLESDGVTPIPHNTTNAEVVSDMPKYNLYLNANPPDGGILSGAGEYYSGTSITISAISNEGFEFLDWIDTNGQEISTHAEFAFTMPASDATLTANFIEDDIVLPPDWTPVENLPFNMDIIGVLQLTDGSFSLNTNDLIAGFVDDECRGVISPVIEDGGVFVLTIGSNQMFGETITFKAYLSDQDIIVELDQDMVFENLLVVGTMAEPFIFTYDGIKDHITLKNISIEYGSSECFNAKKTITVAGEESFFTVQSGGEAKLIAGESIIFLPGTVVKSGGYLHAYIDDVFCDDLRPINYFREAINTSNHKAPDRADSDQLFRVFPNPTDGYFTLELTSFEAEKPLRMEIFGLYGNIIKHQELNHQKQHTVSLIDQKPGMYIVRVTIGDRVGIERLIKR